MLLNRTSDLMVGLSVDIAAPSMGQPLFDMLNPVYNTRVAATTARTHLVFARTSTNASPHPAHAGTRLSPLGKVDSWQLGKRMRTAGPEESECCTVKVGLLAVNPHSILG